MIDNADEDRFGLTITEAQKARIYKMATRFGFPPERLTFGDGEKRDGIWASVCPWIGRNVSEMEPLLKKVIEQIPEPIRKIGLLGIWIPEPRQIIGPSITQPQTERIIEWFEKEGVLRGKLRIYAPNLKGFLGKDHDQWMLIPWIGIPLETFLEEFGGCVRKIKNKPQASIVLDSEWDLLEAIPSSFPEEIKRFIASKGA